MSDRRRRSESRSSEGDRRKQRSDRSDSVDVISLKDADAAFILGKKGKTKEKIARVSGAQMELNRLHLEIRGTKTARERARKYVNCVTSQRVGPVYVEEEADDLTVVEVPQDCVGFVTGTSGTFLRQVEEEFGTLMFFADFRGRDRKKGEIEKLAIFGPERARIGAELKVKAAVESKISGYFTKDAREHVSDGEELGVDTIILKKSEVSWALGKKGSIKRKIAKASGAIVEYVGNVMHACGNRAERSRACEYLRWIMAQLDGPLMVDTEGRKDVTLMHIPHECIGYVTGKGRATLARMEEEFGVFMMFLDKKEEPKEAGATSKLAIFGLKRPRRGAELKVMSTVEGKCPGFFTKGLKEEISRDEWGTDVYAFKGEELSYALGKEGSTKRKLVRASGCIMEYVGDYALFSGTRPERLRGRRYLSWLLKQRSGTVAIEDLPLKEHRDDVATMEIVPAACPHVMGHKGCGLRAVEEETCTFLFMARDVHEDKLLICCAEEQRRRKAEQLIREKISDFLSGRRDRESRRSRSRSRSYDRRSDSRRRYDSRDRDYRDSRRDDDYRRRRSPSRDSRGRSPSRDHKRARRYDSDSDHDRRRGRR